MSVENVVRKHMEAMHDDLLELLHSMEGLEPADGEEFAACVSKLVLGGMMTGAEYAEWFDEEVSA